MRTRFLVVLCLSPLFVPTALSLHAQAATVQPQSQAAGPGAVVSAHKMQSALR